MTKVSSNRLELGNITQHNIKQIRLFNSVIFPVTYNEKFYKEIQNVDEFAKMAFFNDVFVGAVCCRIENVASIKKVYIMTLGVLAPYRKLGVGRLMLEHIIAQCEKDTSITTLYLHVQTNNDDAVEFYSKFGFSKSDTIENYYKRIDPPHAFILSKSFDGSDKTEASTMNRSTTNGSEAITSSD